MSRGTKLKLTVVLIFFSGALWAVSMRFILIDRPTTHYHADFAISINGEIDPLTEFTFYEELTACSPEYENNPSSRVHLHSNIPTAVHVHDKGATWGNLLENIDYTLGRSILVTSDGVFVDGKEGQLRFILNGSEVAFVNNRLIGDQDVLLIDFSDDDLQTLLDRQAAIPRLADINNQTDDPAACAGSSSESFMDRLKRTIGYNQT
jgi:hypothetical protein